MKILFENEFLCIRVNPEDQIIEAETLKFTPFEIAQPLMEKIYDAFCETGYKKLITITTNIQTIPPKLKEYVDTIWYPKMVELGVLTSAYLLPSNVIGKLAALSMNRNSEVFFEQNGVVAKYFTDIYKAREWLAHQPLIPLL